MASAVISAASSGANTIVAAQAGKVIVVQSYTFVVNNNVTVTWKSGSTAISGAMLCGPTNLCPGMSIPYNPNGMFETAAGEALILTLGGAIQVSGFLTYIIRG